MKRDLDLIRLILIDFEGEGDVSLSGYTEAQINYHKALIKEAGFAVVVIHYPSFGPSDTPDIAILKRLTWEGHEFLDKAKNEKTWNKAKSIIKSKGMSLSMEAVKLAMSEAVKALMN
ncbi:MAG: hypothetical protein JWP66_2080 [Naasia sp.]|nr:hypothetical protein [Naasia sp.]